MGPIFAEIKKAAAGANEPAAVRALPREPYPSVFHGIDDRGRKRGVRLGTGE